MARKFLEEALTLKEGDIVIANFSSVSPRITSGRKYELVGNPIPIYTSFRFGRIHSSNNPSDGEFSNVYFPIVDDRGKRIEISYSRFSYL